MRGKKTKPIPVDRFWVVLVRILFPFWVLYFSLSLHLTPTAYPSSSPFLHLSLAYPLLIPFYFWAFYSPLWFHLFSMAGGPFLHAYACFIPFFFSFVITLPFYFYFEGLVGD